MEYLGARHFSRFSFAATLSSRRLISGRASVDRVWGSFIGGMAVSWGCAPSCRTGKVGRGGFLWSRTNGGGYDLLQRRDANPLLQLDDPFRGNAGVVGLAAMWLGPHRSV